MPASQGAGRCTVIPSAASLARLLPSRPKFAESEARCDRAVKGARTGRADDSGKAGGSLAAVSRTGGWGWAGRTAAGNAGEASRGPQVADMQDARGEGSQTL